LFPLGRDFDFSADSPLAKNEPRPAPTSTPLRHLGLRRRQPDQRSSRSFSLVSSAPGDRWLMRSRSEGGRVPVPWRAGALHGRGGSGRFQRVLVRFAQYNGRLLGWLLACLPVQRNLPPLCTAVHATIVGEVNLSFFFSRNKFELFNTGSRSLHRVSCRGRQTDFPVQRRAANHMMHDKLIT
jgi:hypothetical protein